MSCSPITHCLVAAFLALPPTTEPAADPLPAGAVAQFGSPRFQDRSIGRSLAFSSDGTKLATADNNGPVSVWDAATGKLIRTHKVVGSVYEVRWTPDGKLVALAFFQGKGAFMHQWADGPDDGPSRERIQELATAVANVKQQTEATILSAAGRLVVGVRDPYGAKRIVEVFAFKPNFPTALAVPERSIPIGNRHNLWLSRDGQTLLAHGFGQSGERLAAFDLTPGNDADKPAWELELQTPGDHRVTQCLSADGRRVVLAFLNGDVELWGGPSGKLLRELPKAPVYYLTGGGENPALVLSPDGKRLAMVTRQKNGEVGGRVIALDTGKELVALATRPLPRLGWGKAFSPNGEKLAVAGAGAVRIWDAQTGADASPLPGHVGRINSVVVSPDGKTVVTAGADLTVRAWDPATGREKWKTAFPQVVDVTLATVDAVAVEQVDIQAVGIAEPLLDLATGKARPLPGQMGKGRKSAGFGGNVVVYDSLVAVAPDGKSAVTVRIVTPVLGGQQDSSLQVWSWPAGELKKSITVEAPSDLLVSRVRGRLTADGKELRTVTWCRLGKPQFSGPNLPPMLIDRWDTATGKRLEREQTCDCYPVWTAEGSRLLVVRGGKIQEAFTGKSAGRLPHSNVDPFTVWALGGMVLSPNGKFIAVGGGFRHPGSVRVCDVQSGNINATLLAGGHGRIDGAFLPDGRLVTTGETAIVWAADKVGQPKKP
jgi:WD40 repeat protein